MLNIRLFSFLLTAMIFVQDNCYAQNNSKAEKAIEKEWATKLKNLKPLEYKALVEEAQSLKANLEQTKEDAAKASAAVAPLESKLSEKDAQLTALQTEITELKNALSAAQSQQTSTAVGSSPRAKSISPPSSSKKVAGLLYKVQIGAFRNKDLTKYFENSPNFTGEVDTDGTKKYTLGLFEDYWEADNFKKYLREMGVTDAWIVAYKDGKRVALKDAREGVL
jgi:hypothetical protein